MKRAGHGAIVRRGVDLPLLDGDDGVEEPVVPAVDSLLMVLS